MARPRGFDVDVALDRAMRLFWTHGYEGTSIDDLTRELGIAKPSLYAAFGNKRALFDRVLDRYASAVRTKVERALAEPRAEDAARRFLLEYVDVPADQPAGCLLVQGALVCSSESNEVRLALADRRREAEAMLAKRLARAAKEGDLSADVRPADLARYLTTVANGLAVQGAGGGTAAERRRVVNLAMTAWPKPAT